MKPAEAITMRAVAERAGVSRATVSRALRNHPGIPEATRRRVLDAAETLGYRPNPLVATLMAQLHTGRSASETPTLAVLDFSLTHPCDWSTNAFLQFEAGARSRAHALGFELEHFWCNEPEMTASRMQKILHTRNIAGVLVPPATYTGGRPMDLDWSRFAVAGLASMRDEPRINRAGADHFFNAQLALDRLSALGCRRAGFVMNRGMSRLTKDRWLGGFHAWHHGKGGPHDAPVHLPDTLSADGLAKWLDRFVPDAILYMGGEVPGLLKQLGIRTPDELGVVTLNRTPWEEFHAGVSENSDAVGAAAVDLLIAQIHRNERGLPENPYTVLVKGVWRPGSSVRNRTAAG
jgi:DNA-binding LacI/PurR family transcriptional regulator